MENLHPMHQFLKRSKRKKIKLRDLEDRILKHLIAEDLDCSLSFLKGGETGFSLIILVVNRSPELLVLREPSFEYEISLEVIGVIEDIPKDLLIREILNQGGDLDIDRQYIVGGKKSLVMKWIKSEINEESPPEYTAVQNFGMRERFSKEEWERLRVLICQIFIAVAGADGVIDTKEKEAFVKFLENIPFSKEPSIKEIFPNSKTFLLYFDAAHEGGIRGFQVNLKRVKKILKQKLDIDEFQNFGKMLFNLGYEVAMASGGFLGLGRKVCKEEQMVLDFLVDFFNLEKTDFKKKKSESSAIPVWLKELPVHLRPQQEKIDKLENLRVKFNVPHRLFGLRVLSSPSTTVKVQKVSYNRLRKRFPRVSEKGLLRKVLEQRLQTPPVTPMSKKEIDEAMEEINSLNDLCEFIISLDELEPATPDPLGIGRRIDEILAEEDEVAENLCEDGVTPLMIACCGANVETVRELLKEGARVNAKSIYGWTPLMFACFEQGGNLGISKVLIDFGADVLIKTNKGETALMMAVQSKNTELVRFLIKIGCDVKAVSNDGLTALSIAKRLRNDEIIALLEKSGAQG